MSTNRLWKQFHIYTDERDQDQLLIEAVGPFLDEVIQSGLATRGYFLRGRLQKQLYLRLCFDTDAPWAEVPQQLLYDILQQRGLDTLVHHVEEVQYTGFADTQETVQGPAVQPLLEDFFSDTTEFLLTSLAEIKNNRKLLLQIAFDLMVAHVIAINQTLFLWMRHLPYPSSFVSYHSHADGFFIMSKNPQVTKKAFADRYMSLSSSMQERLAKLLQQLNQNGATASMISPPAQAWVWYINKYIQRVINEVSSGRLQFLSGDGYLGDHNDISISLVHQAIQQNPQFQEFMKTDVEFLSMRMGHSCLYLTLHRLGLRLIERYFLCYAISRCIEEMFDIDPMDLVLSLATFSYNSSSPT